MFLKPSFLRHNQCVQMKDESNIPYKSLCEADGVPREQYWQKHSQVNDLRAPDLGNALSSWGPTIDVDSMYGEHQSQLCHAELRSEIVLQRLPTRISSPASSPLVRYIVSILIGELLVVVDLLQSSQPMRFQHFSVCVCHFFTPCLHS